MKQIIFLSLIVVISGCSRSIEGEFIDGCTSTGISIKLCECVYDKIETTLGKKKVETMIENMEEKGSLRDLDIFLKTMEDAEKQCRVELHNENN